MASCSSEFGTVPNLEEGQADGLSIFLHTDTGLTVPPPTLFSMLRWTNIIGSQ